MSKKIKEFPYIPPARRIENITECRKCFEEKPLWDPESIKEDKIVSEPYVVTPEMMKKESPTEFNSYYLKCQAQELEWDFEFMQNVLEESLKKDRT